MNLLEISALFGLVLVVVYLSYSLGKEDGRRDGIHLTNNIEPHITVDAELIIAALKHYGYRIVRDEPAETRTEH